MALADNALNLSEAAFMYSHINERKPILTYKHRMIILVVNNAFVCTFVGLFGMVTNIINLVVFYKQGLDSSINITFFALAIADLGGILVQQWFNVCVNPLFEASDIPMVPSEFQFMTAGVPRVGFSKITCMITAYATIERCLCIAFPLHIKQLITPRKTGIAMVGIYAVMVLSIAPLYITTSIGWKFYPDRNKTLLGLIFDTTNVSVTEALYVVHACIGLLAFFAVVIFTAVLIRKLGQKSAWRRSAGADQTKSETMSNRDRKTMSLIVLIASVLILCYTPSFILMIVAFFEVEFNIAGLYTNLFFVTWSFGSLFETINSSVNIVLYFKMSTNYREMFYVIFGATR